MPMVPCEQLTRPLVRGHPRHTRRVCPGWSVITLKERVVAEPVPLPITQQARRVFMPCVPLHMLCPGGRNHSWHGYALGWRGLHPAASWMRALAARVSGSAAPPRADPRDGAPRARRGRTRTPAVHV